VTPESDAIAGYAKALAARLAFDRGLARAMREEVEDHLWQAAAAETAGDPHEAQRRAVANFGDPQVLAPQFAAAALARQARGIGVSVLLVLAGVLLAMTARVTWYELTQWGLRETALELSAALGLVDRCAFLLAAIGGVAGWARSGGRLRLWALAAAGLVASVVCDGLLTALRLWGWEFSADFFVPLLSMAAEVACVALLVYQMLVFARRTAAAEDLLQS
jgi:hypothetical protein